MDDGLDFRKRDDLVKTRDEDLRFVKHKEDGWTHREREMRGQGSGMSCKE